jgi:hypothetical protein
LAVPPLEFQVGGGTASTEVRSVHDVVVYQEVGMKKLGGSGHRPYLALGRTAASQGTVVDQCRAKSFPASLEELGDRFCELQSLFCHRLQNLASGSDPGVELGIEAAAEISQLPAESLRLGREDVAWGEDRRNCHE